MLKVTACPRNDIYNNSVFLDVVANSGCWRTGKKNLRFNGKGILKRDTGSPGSSFTCVKQINSRQSDKMVSLKSQIVPYH